MANQIIGKFIAVSQIENIASKDPSKQPMQKRSLFLDCTRFDAISGERGFENTPVLEFGGKGLEKLNELVNNGLKKDDIVIVSFDIQGTKYEKDGKTKVYTYVRPYDIQLKPKNEQQAPPASAPSQGQEDNDLPF